MKELKRLAVLTDGKWGFPDTFKANGNEYVIEGSLSFDRLEMYEQLEVELGLGLRLQTVLEKLDEQKACYDDGRHADAIIVNHELRTSAYHKMEGKTNTAFDMCALFINRVDEDRRYINRDMIKAKVHDWKEEGYAVNDFFQFAISSIPGYINAYGKHSQSTLT
jgi:hypothetical protein